MNTIKSSNTHDTSMTMARGIYAHGDLEMEMGFDLILMDSIPSDGVSQAAWEGQECNVYVWGKSQRGLVVLRGDAEGNADAMVHFHAKTETL